MNKIHETFGRKGLGILVDANDGYSLQDTIDFFEGVKEVPIYWFEEPLGKIPNIPQSSKVDAQKWSREYLLHRW